MPSTMMAPAAFIAFCSIIFATIQSVRTDVVCSGVTLASSDIRNLNYTLTGQVYLPGSAQYEDGSIMKNTFYNSDFCMVILVESAEDVSKVIQFCERHGVRPTVKSGGHDYIGRSSGNGSVSINLAAMTAINFLNDDRVEVEAGNTWNTTYYAVNARNKLIVGGNAITVSPGGYTQGGGHSPMSPSFGLAVDNTVGFVLVTPDGSIVNFTESGATLKRNGVETEFDDPELFWAVRGGGGGTFGVVTSYIFKVHDAPPDGFCQILAAYPILYEGFGNVGKPVLDGWNQLVLSGLPDNLGGYVVFTSSKIPELPMATGTITFALLHRGGCNSSTAMAVNQSLAAIVPEARLYHIVRSHATFWDYAKSGDDETGFRTYIINRLIQPADLSGNLPTVLTDITKAELPVLCTWTLLGGKVSQFPASSSSVTPKFRTSLGSLSCGGGWLDPKNDSRQISAMQEYGKRMYTIGDGVYFNEPDYYLEDWEVEYWGSMENYKRLLLVKDRYDPGRLFQCHHCVGDGAPAQLAGLMTPMVFLVHLLRHVL